jgi:hypothetical protein
LKNVSPVRGKGDGCPSSEGNRSLSHTILGLISERGKKGLPLEHVYKLLFNKNLYLEAYGKIYRNKGAMTHGVTDETPDGMSLEKIDAIIEAIRYERYQWLPARRVYILKKSGKKRPLGMPMVRSYCPPYGKLSGLSCRVDWLIRSTLVLM